MGDRELCWSYFILAATRLIEHGKHKPTYRLLHGVKEERTPTLSHLLRCTKK